jgi:hypothetical protein
MVATPINSTLGRPKQENWEFEASLGWPGLKKRERERERNTPLAVIRKK